MQHTKQLSIATNGMPYRQNITDLYVQSQWSTYIHVSSKVLINTKQYCVQLTHIIQRNRVDKVKAELALTKYRFVVASVAPKTEWTKDDECELLKWTASRSRKLPTPQIQTEIVHTDSYI
jgi:hypothetical protein